MRHPAPTSCPVCAASLRIARLECDACKTALEGDFQLGRLGRLSREQLAFVEVFLECRGKIKDVEQQLGLSYPTVVSRLDQVVHALGSRDAPADGREKQIDEALSALARGEITPGEAAALLKQTRSGRRGSSERR